MSDVTVEVEIREGQVLPREGSLPKSGTGLLTILQTDESHPEDFPFIKGTGKRKINPSREEIDAITWGD